MVMSLEVNNLTVSYSNKVALKDVNFSIERGKLVGIIGPNGSGKSSLMKSVLNLTAKDSGEIKINGEVIEKNRENIAYIPQRTNIDWDFPILVKDTVLLGTFPKLGLFKRPKEKEKKLAADALKKSACRISLISKLANFQAASSKESFLPEVSLKMLIFFSWMSLLSA